MIFQSTLNAFMQKVRPGNVQAQAVDAKLELGNHLVHAGRFPFPVTKTLIAGEVLAAGSEVIGSFMAQREQQIGLGLALNPWIALPTGVWDLDISYWLQPLGVVSDLTAIASMQILITDGGLNRGSEIMALTGSLVIPQQFNRRFTISVSKDIPVAINLNHVVGLGTATSSARAQVIASRII